MTDTSMETPTEVISSEASISYQRFDISQRVEHIVFLPIREEQADRSSEKS